MWFYRRTLRVPWTARSTRKEVLQTAGVSREMMTLLRETQRGFLCYILGENGLQKDCMLGIDEVQRERGGQKTKVMDEIKEVIGCETIVGVLQLLKTEVPCVPLQLTSTFLQHFGKVYTTTGRNSILSLRSDPSRSHHIIKQCLKPLLFLTGCLKPFEHKVLQTAIS